VQDWAQNTRALKLLVLVMTTLLVLGLILLVVGLARTAGELGRGIGEVRVELPAGARIEEASLDGERLLLRLSGPGAGERTLLLVEVATGRRLGLLRLEEAAP